MSDETEPVRQEPPGYPYPGEQIIYSGSEAKAHPFRGGRRSNSPLRGSTSMFVKRTDATTLIQAMLTVLADADDNYGDTARISETWVDRQIAEQYSVEFLPGDGGSDNATHD